MVEDVSVLTPNETAGFYTLIGDITDESVKNCIDWIIFHNFVPQRKKPRELVLAISSDGGDLQAAFALTDVMRSSSIPIKTVGLGRIASSGLLIFMAGGRGRRILTKNTSIMSHQFSWGCEGTKAHELLAAARELSMTTQRMVDHYRECTGLSDDVIRERLLPPNDVWLTPPEALELNVCDHVDTLRGPE